MSDSVPKPVRISVGIGKGGVGKSWVATNIAEYLGRLGRRVMLWDTNSQGNVARDYLKMVKAGFNPSYSCEHQPEPYDEHGNCSVNGSDYDVEVFDTCQYPDRGNTHYAWRYCHIMLAPVTEDAADYDTFREVIKLFSEMSERPILVIPTRCQILQKSQGVKEFSSFLGSLQDTRVLIPPFPPSFHIDYNYCMSRLPVRNVYYNQDGCVRSEDASRQVKPGFIIKWEAYAAWVVQIIDAAYGTNFSKSTKKGSSK